MEKKNIFTLQQRLDPDAFRPATEAEKEAYEQKLNNQNEDRI